VKASPRRLPLVLALALFAFPPSAFAHRLDEYLQATLVDIAPADVRLRINLTPGVAVAEPVIALIDTNHDGVISTGEAAAYAELLRRDLTIRLDGRDVEPHLAASDFPPPAELRTGSGIVRLEFSVTPGLFSAGPHRLTLENRHLPAVSAYLFNAGRPNSASVRVTRQNRNENQSLGEIEFTVVPRPNGTRAAATAGSLAALLLAVFARLWRTRMNARLPA